MSAGTSFWADDGKAGFDNEQGAAALQFLSDLKNKYKVVPDGVSSYKLSDCSEMFNNGQAAMAYLSLGRPDYKGASVPVRSGLYADPNPHARGRCDELHAACVRDGHGCERKKQASRGGEDAGAVDGHLPAELA